MAKRWDLNTVIGQGFMLSTPLQITLMTARIATGKKIIPSIILNKKEFENLNINNENLKFIKSSMFSVVNTVLEQHLIPD